MDAKRTIILGISAFYHDSAAALVVDGEVVAAAQEERFTRKKFDESFPEHSIDFCLGEAGIKINDVSYIVFYDKPILKFERLLQTYLSTWPWGFGPFITAMRAWLGKKLWVEAAIRKATNFKGEILFAEHHLSHAASSYYIADANDATVVTIDGVGEWDTATIGYAKENKITLTHTLHFPHSLGLLYSALTYYLGFKINDGEYKVMGLAPYGNPKAYRKEFEALIDVKDDGSYLLNRSYFTYEHSLKMVGKKFEELFGGPVRTPDSELTQRHKDIAAALQEVTEKIVMRIVKYAHTLYGGDTLVMAGGVALNCVANGKVWDEKLFKNVVIQPAAGDAGGAVGAALWVYFDVLGNKKKGNSMPSPYLGPAYDDNEIREVLSRHEGQITYKKLDTNELIDRVATLLFENAVVGWFQGRMEFGPRALGNRSILADARDKHNWPRVNQKIKFRESFRPFAPTVLSEYVNEFFENAHPSPYMLFTMQSSDNVLPATTHVDGSARVQTLSRNENELFYKLLSSFHKKTGCPALINTSFNVKDEPIVESPKDALKTFLVTEMDYLAVGNYLVGKIFKKTVE